MFEDQVYDILDKKIYTVRFHIFSDIICIAVYGGAKEQSIIDVGLFLIMFMANSLYDRIYFRGCISYGRIIQTKHSILGSALDEAAEYYTLQQWIGISASPSVYNILDKIDSSKFDEYGVEIYVKYDIPLKTSKEKNGWAIK